MNSVAIVQARMGSTRLPGKVLRPLRGMPVLGHVLHRLRKCQELDRIVVAMTDRPEDDELLAWVEDQGIQAVRGSADNVLQRFGLAARLTRAGTIARITGDAPLIDSGTLDRWVAAVRDSGADTVISRPRGRMIHEGMGVFSRSSLDRLLRTAPGDPVAREHVNAWFRQHPGFVTYCESPADPRHYFKKARLSVDTPADFEFLEAVYEELEAAPGELELADLVQLLTHRPELMQINGHVHQKTASEVSRRVLIHCPQEDRALQHALDLAEVLRDRHAIGVILALDHRPEQELSFPVEECPADPEPWLANFCKEKHPDALILVDESVPDSRRFESLVAHWGAGEGSGADLELPGEDALEAAEGLDRLFTGGILAA